MTDEKNEPKLPNRVHREMLLAMIAEWNDLLRERKSPSYALDIAAFQKNPHPEFFHVIDPFSSVVDLSAFAPGLGVKLKDCTMRAGNEIQRVTRMRNKDDAPMTKELTGSYLAAHFDGFVGISVEWPGDGAEPRVSLSELEDPALPLQVFSSDPPKPEAGSEAWGDWGLNGKEKAVRQILNGIITYRAMEIETGN